MFSYRRPKDVLVSTYITFSRVRSRVKLLDRKKPLIIQGPYSYVRHPLRRGAAGVWLLAAAGLQFSGSLGRAVAAVVQLRYSSFPRS
ncbi:MAG: hypothetical protein QXK69_11615 [Candidatus Caldarchaeum sp.]